MVASAVAADGANERDAKATVQCTGGLLAVHGIQSRIVGDEQAWGRPPAEVSTIFCFLHLFKY
jgi:hypothetical protein